MRERVLRRALLASIAVLPVLAVPAAASAAIVYVSPQITGAGSVTALTDTCTQAPPVSDSAVYDCSQTWKVSASVDVTATPADGWKFVKWTGCTSVTGTVCTVTGPEGGKVPTVTKATPVAYFADIRKPEVTKPVAVPSTQKDRAAVITWDADEPGVSYKCAEDGAKPVPCTSPLTFEGEERKHSVDVVGTDPSGLMSKSQRVDFALLDTTLFDGPAEGSVTRDDSAVFHVTSAFRGATFECSLDSEAFRSCDGAGVALDQLADGKHELRVRATSAGSYDGIPAARTWTVDRTPPDTQLTGSGGVLEFKASEPGATLECRLDGGLFIGCTSPQSVPSLAPGDHAFEVRAIDKLGNADATPARYEWTVPAPPVSTPTPTPAPIVIPAPPAPAPAPIVIAAAPPKLTPALSFRYVAGRRGTRFTRLAATGLPAWTKLTVTVTSPNGKRRTLSSLKPLIGKRLKPGTKIAVAGMTITIRRGKSPRVS